jgi:hypothetical protein
MGRGKNQVSNVVSSRASQPGNHLGIKVIMGSELEPQLHTILQDSRPAPDPSLYRQVEDAWFIDCIPYGGFWTENHRDESLWSPQRDGSSYSLVARPDTKILIVDTVEKAELLLRTYPAAAEKEYSDAPFTVSVEELRAQGFDGLWVTGEVARETTIFDMWDNDSIFWFSKEWPFLEDVKLVKEGLGSPYPHLDL